MDKDRVGRFLKQLREQKGKKQYQVAMDLAEYGIEVSDKAVAKWEKGNFPDMEKLGILAEYYGVSVSDILNGEVYTPQNFAEKYFIASGDWMHHRPKGDNLYQVRVEQEHLIKKRVKELLFELIEKKSLTVMQNEELNFLLSNFYSVSDYAVQENDELSNHGNGQVKLLRRAIYREILTMHDSSVEEIYWEIKKLFIYNRRLTFEKNVRGFEDDISETERLLRGLEDWEKDLLLAQVQTQNITDFYDELTYFRRHGIEYDEERITKEGIKLLIKCGAKLNPALLGYTVHRYEHFSILDRMETLYAAAEAKMLISEYNEEKHAVEYYWAENTAKNRLIDLYYAMNLVRKGNEKLSFDELYKLFLNNEIIPNDFLLNGYREHIDKNMSAKEQLLLVHRLGDYEIETWRKCKDREQKIEEYKRELHELEEQWNAGEEIGVVEYDEWMGEEEDVLTETDVLQRLSQMSFAEYVASRNTELTEKLFVEIDSLSLEDIRKKYFPVEERYEEKLRIG